MKKWVSYQTNKRTCAQIQSISGDNGSLKWRRRRRRKKRRVLKNNFIDSRKFVRQYLRNGDMDLSELRDIDSLHNEGTNTLVKGGLG